MDLRQNFRHIYDKNIAGSCSGCGREFLSHMHFTSEELGMLDRPKVNPIGTQVLIGLGAVVVPGDTLIIGLDTEVSMDQADNMQKEMEKLIPGIKAILIYANSMAVYRPGTSEIESPIEGGH